MSDLVKPLSKRLKHFQFDRPSEWLMKEFVQQAKELEAENKAMRELLESVHNEAKENPAGQSKEVHDLLAGG